VLLDLAACELLALAALPGELSGHLGRLRKHGGTLLTVRVGVLSTLLSAGLGGPLEGLDELRGKARGAWPERENGLAYLDYVFTELDALYHLRVRFLDAFVGTPATHLDRLCDRAEALAVLLWELSGVLALHPALLLVLLGLRSLLGLLLGLRLLLCCLAAAVLWCLRHRNSQFTDVPYVNGRSFAGVPWCYRR